MPWKVVEVDVQEEDATVNLTSQGRTAALYKVDELAKVTSDEEIRSFPIITSTAVSAAAFCVSVFNEVHIFNGDQSSFLATLSLETNVDAMAWSPDSQILVIGDSSGTIHFFSFACKDVVFSTKLVDVAEESCSSGSAFINCIFTSNDESDGADLFILCANGFLFTFKDLPLRDFSAAVESNNAAFVKKIGENIQMEVTDISHVHDTASYTTSTPICGKSSVLLAGSGDAVVSIWSEQNVVDVIDSELLPCTGAQKCQVSLGGKYLIVLDELSNLSVWDTHTLIILSVPCHSVKDFVLTTCATADEADTVGPDEGQVVVLIDDGNQDTHFEIYQLPQFQKIYSMNTSQSCSFAEFSYQEKVFYSEENTTKISNNNSVTDLTIKCLSEASPEHRVFTLVRKKKFDSALEFSRAFGLDVEFVYKAKSSTILAEISSKTSESDKNSEEKICSVDGLIDELQESLGNVKSIEFCVDSCLKASPPRLEQVQKLLLFAKEKVSNVSSKQKQNYLKEIADVLVSLHRLQTFQMVFGDEHFSAHRWQQFCCGDMLTQVMQFLSQGKMSNAAIVWRRHQDEFQNSLTAESLKNVLASIRMDLPSSSIIPWLKSHLIPFVVCSQYNTDALRVLASWLEQRVASLELSEKENWPGNGLQMAVLLFDVLSECGDENSNYMNIPTPIIISQVYGSALVQVFRKIKNSNAHPVSRLSLLVEHLTELKKLYLNYHTRIPLAEFTKETPLGIMFKMLDSVLTLELIPSVINGQIVQYGIQHGFQVDDVLLKYIDKQVVQVSVSKLSNSLCEARLVEITKCIKSRTVRVQAILQLMSWASVPWSNVVEEMVKKAMAEDPSNENLKCSHRLMELKKILSHYGLRGIEFSNDAHVKGVVKYILGTPNETALEDALQIVATYRCLSEEEVFFIRLQNLCVKGQLSECMRLMQVLPNIQVTSVVQKLLIWVSIILQDDPVDETDSQEHNIITEAAIHVLECLRNTCGVSDDMNNCLVTLKNIFALQNEFSIFMSVGDYDDPNTREEFLLAYLSEHSMSVLISSSAEEGDDSCYQMLRLGNLFGLSFPQLLAKILLHEVLNGSELFKSTTVYNQWLGKVQNVLFAEDILQLCVAILQEHASVNADLVTLSDTSVPLALYSLACTAVTNVKVGDLSHYLDLCSLCWLNTLLFIHCESGDLEMSTSICDENPLTLWNGAHRFDDNGFVLDANVALPLHCKFVQALLSASECSSQFLKKLAIAGRDLVLYLQENNLHEVALHCALHSLSHLLQYSAAEKDFRDVEQPEKGSLADGVEEDSEELSKMCIQGVNHVAGMLLNLAAKVLHDNGIDHSLALGYLCSIPEDAALQKLRSDFTVGRGRNSSQAIAVFRIAFYYASSFCHQNVAIAIDELYSAALWYSRLQKLNISSASLLMSKSNFEPTKVLELLLEKPGIDVTEIVEFCKSFDIDIDTILHSYILDNLIGGVTCTSGDSTCSLSKGSAEDEIGIKSFEANFIHATSCISDQNELLPLLNDALTSLSPYDYERIMIVLNAIIENSSGEDRAVSERQMEVLQILVKYRRTACPSEYEQQYHQESRTIVKKERVAQTTLIPERLPFHPLIYGNPWKIIAPELNDETIPKLLPLCRLLKIKEDHVYVAAVNKLVSSCLLDQRLELRLSSENSLPSSNFEKAAKLLSLVSDLEFAVKTAMTLLTKWPQSEEKVKAAKATVELAFKWKSSCGDNELQRATNIYKIAKDMSQEIAIHNILFSKGVTEAGFFKLSKKPVKLIFKLYEDFGGSQEAKVPNIQKMAEEIAEISDLNITKIRGRLVEAWLPSACSGTMRSPEYIASENKDRDRDNLKRVMCLLEAGTVEKNVLFLLNFAFRNGPSKVTYESRIRAIEVLFNIASREVIEAVASNSLDSIRNYMKSLIYLAELEHLHLPQTVESFERCNKEGLVKGLWKNHKENPNAMLLIADICLDSKISDPQIWTNILKQLLHLGLTKYLSNLLPSLARFPELWQVSNLIKIWESVALQALEKAEKPLSDEDYLLCQKSMLLLQKCPIMMEVDLERIVQTLLGLGLFSCALACLSLLPREKKVRNIDPLISVSGVNHLLNMIANERAVGSCFICPDVLESLVFNAMLGSGLCDVLHRSEHFGKFVDHLIAVKRLVNIVMEMLKLGRLEFAVELAQYYEMHVAPLQKKALFNEERSSATGVTILRSFLDSAGVLKCALPYLPLLDDPAVADEKPTLNLVDPVESEEHVSSNDVDLYDVF